MDSNTSQDAAQPLASNAEQQNPQPHQHPPPAPQQASPVPGNPNDAFVCQWVGCAERSASAESLYVSPRTKVATLSHKSLLMRSLGACLRSSHWAEKYKQPQPSMRMGQLPRRCCQTRPHHVPHPCPCSTKTAPMRVLWKGLQASSRSQKACQDSRR